jgi:hypothetical protein
LILQKKKKKNISRGLADMPFHSKGRQAASRLLLNSVAGVQFQSIPCKFVTDKMVLGQVSLREPWFSSDRQTHV